RHRVRVRPTSLLFPYTTLFRSALLSQVVRAERGPDEGGAVVEWLPVVVGRHAAVDRVPALAQCRHRLHAQAEPSRAEAPRPRAKDRKSTRLNSSHGSISYAVFC